MGDSYKNDLFEVLTQKDDNQFGVVLENSFANYDPNNPIIKNTERLVLLHLSMLQLLQSPIIAHENKL